MIKSIDLQAPSKFTIIKNGEVIASLYVSGIKGSINVDDNVKVYTLFNENNLEYEIKLEV